MELHQFAAILIKKKQTVMFVVILFLIGAAVITFVQPMQYASWAKILVVQNYSPKTDAYVVSRSNEYLSTVLAQVINTNSFFNEVMNSGFDINKNYFGENYSDQMKKWHAAVSAKPLNDTGIISLTVYHKDRNQSEQILQGINAVMKAKHQDYHGAGDQVEIRTIDQPITSNYPVKPNILLNMLAGLMLGLVFSLSYVYLFPEVGNPAAKAARPLIQKNENIAEKQLFNKQPDIDIPSRPAETPVRPDDTGRHQIYQQAESPRPAYDDLDISGNMRNIFGQSGLNR